MGEHSPKQKLKLPTWKHPRNLEQDRSWTDPEKPEYLIALPTDLGVRW